LSTSDVPEEERFIGNDLDGAQRRFETGQGGFVICCAGWDMQRFGVEQDFLHRVFPEVVSADDMLNALNFCSRGASRREHRLVASGLGARSMTIGYGFNRADWSYIPEECPRGRG